jgi:hypothetical protein
MIEYLYIFSRMKLFPPDLSYGHIWIRHGHVQHFPDILCDMCQLAYAACVFWHMLNVIEGLILAGFGQKIALHSICRRIQSCVEYIMTAYTVCGNQNAFLLLFSAKHLVVAAESRGSYNAVFVTDSQFCPVPRLYLREFLFRFAF